MKNQIFTALASALLISLIFLYALEIVAFDGNFYEDQYQKNNIYEHFAKEEVNKVTDELLNYLHYEKSDKLIDNPFFNIKEKQHLLDVKNILHGAKNFRIILTVLFVIVMVLFYFIPNKNYGQIFLISGGVGLGILLLLGILMAFNFSTAFTLFHKTLFTNELWMLDPTIDNLVVLYPEPFWSAIAARLFIYLFIGYTLLLAIGTIKAR